MKKIFYLLVLLFITVACEQTIEQEDIKTPITETNLAGNWTVNAYIDSNMIFGPFTITTQVASKNQSLHIKDNGGFWDFQTKAEILDSKNTFETISTINEVSNLEAKINILSGTIINNDSIAFDVQFEDDETPYAFTYKIMGRRK